MKYSLKVTAQWISKKNRSNKPKKDKQVNKGIKNQKEQTENVMIKWQI